MRPADLLPAELAHLLDHAYQQDRGVDVRGLALEWRTALADHLGCHQDVRAQAWEAWLVELEFRGEDLHDAAYWLDVEFVEPCPEENEEV